LIERGRAHLAACDIDAVQMEVYDLSVSTAELHAADAMLEYADHPSPSGEASYKRSLANMFCADALARVLGRLQARPSAFGLRRAQFDGESQRFIDEYLTPSTIALLGETIRRRQGRAPDDHLGGAGIVLAEERGEGRSEAPCHRRVEFGRDPAADVVGADDRVEASLHGRSPPGRLAWLLSHRTGRPRRSRRGAAGGGFPRGPGES